MIEIKHEPLLENQVHTWRSRLLEIEDVLVWKYGLRLQGSNSTSIHSTIEWLKSERPPSVEWTEYERIQAQIKMHSQNTIYYCGINDHVTRD